jgi:hypothetical protein
MTRFVVNASLVLFSNQASRSIGLCCGSQFDSRKLGLVSLLLNPDRTMLANSKAMRLELAAFGCHATNFMQVPKPTCDLIHRPDNHFGLVVCYADLLPNVNHPLVALASGPRNEQRQHVLGSILARLAVGPTSSKSTAVSQPSSLNVAPCVTESSLIKQETGQ